MEITMKYILDKFKYCNIFSLSYSLPIQNIPSIDKQNLIENHLEIEKNFLLEYYKKFSEKEKINTDFDTLFEDIVNECQSFYLKIKDKDITSFFGTNFSPFICDHVGKDTKYSEPLGLIWHFYHNIQHVFMSNDNLKQLPETEGFVIEDIFNKNEHLPLKNNFLKYEYTYSTHCTKGPLQLVIYFNLNEQTKEWLMKFKDDYDLSGSDFEDLAIYNNDKLEFSSCTHEGFNSLDSSN